MNSLKNRKDLRDLNIADTWRLIVSSKEIKTCVQNCANYINTRFEGKNVVVVCILKGAAYFFVDLTRKLTIPHSTYFIEATSYHNNQTQSDHLSIMSSIEPSKFTDKHVILLDELYDNGQTMAEIKQAIHEKADVPLDMIFTCVAFRKNKETKYPKPDLFGVTVPNIWLVGYGLDDKQEKRHWNDLYACPKCEGVAESADDIIFRNNIEYELLRSMIIKEILTEKNETVSLPIDIPMPKQQYGTDSVICMV